MPCNKFPSKSKKVIPLFMYCRPFRNLLTIFWKLRKICHLVCALRSTVQRWMSLWFFDSVNQVSVVLYVLSTNSFMQNCKNSSSYTCLRISISPTFTTCRPATFTTCRPATFTTCRPTTLAGVCPTLHPADRHTPGQWWARLHTHRHAHPCPTKEWVPILQ